MMKCNLDKMKMFYRFWNGWDFSREIIKLPEPVAVAVVVETKWHAMSSQK